MFDYDPNQTFNRIGMVARWRPVHNGHTPVLRGLYRQGDEVLIGIGSANRYNLRNPFTVAETEAMLRLVLPAEANVSLLPIADLDDGPRWRSLISDTFGPLDAFVTANPYVAKLMAEVYPVLHPVTFVPPAERLPLDGTMVRLAMAQGEEWQKLVPPAVADYLHQNELDQRFRQEFGLEALALETVVNRTS